MSTTAERTIKAVRITWTGIIVNLILTSFKFVAGFVGHSTAIIADAVHSLADFATDIVLLLGFRVVNKPIDKTHDYGHGKVETLMSLIMGGGLIIVGLNILWGASVKIFREFKGIQIMQPGWIAFIAAFLSVIFKEWLYRITLQVGKEINSQAVIANAWEHRSDVFVSLAAMFGIGGAIVLGGEWHILDPIAAIVVSLLIIKVAVPIAFGSLNDLMECSLSDEAENEITQTILSVHGVKNPHEMKTRKIGNNVAIDVHIEVDKGLNVAEAHEVATNVEQKLKATYGEETYVSVHIEPSEQ